MSRGIKGVFIVIVILITFSLGLYMFNDYMSKKTIAQESRNQEIALYEKKQREEAIKYAQEIEVARQEEEDRLSHLNFFEKLNEEQTAQLFILGDEAIGSLAVAGERATWEYVLQQDLLDRYKMPMRVEKSAFFGATSPLGSITYDGMLGGVEPDLVVIGYGYNDMKYQTVEMFSLFYERLIRDIISKYPETNFLLVKDYRLSDDNDYMKTIDRIGSYYGIDVLRPFYIDELDESLQSLVVDEDQWLTYQGNILIAKKIRQYIDVKVDEGVTGITVKQDLTPMNLEVAKLDDLEAMADVFQREGIDTFGDISVGYKEGAYTTYITSREYILFSFVTSRDGGVLTIKIDGNTVMDIDTKGEDGSMVTVALSVGDEDEKLIEVIAKEIDPEKGQKNVKYLGISTN